MSSFIWVVKILATHQSRKADHLNVSVGREESLQKMETFNPLLPFVSEIELFE